MYARDDRGMVESLPYPQFPELVKRRPFVAGDLLMIDVFCRVRNAGFLGDGHKKRGLVTLFVSEASPNALQPNK